MSTDGIDDGLLGLLITTAADPTRAATGRPGYSRSYDSVHPLHAVASGASGISSTTVADTNHLHVLNAEHDDRESLTRPMRLISAHSQRLLVTLATPRLLLTLSKLKGKEGRASVWLYATPPARLGPTWLPPSPLRPVSRRAGAARTAGDVGQDASGCQRALQTLTPTALLG